MDFSILWDGLGFALGGSIVYAITWARNNSKEHADIKEALKEHAVSDGEKLEVLTDEIRNTNAKLDRVCDKLDRLFDTQR